MPNFWKVVDEVMRDADIILMVVDARLIKETRNKEIEAKVKEMGKILITVINKCDLVEKDLLEPYKQRLHPCVFVSAQKFYGITLLRNMISRYSKGEPVTVGIVGYPNTGKSSVINALKGKSSAAVSSVSGYTKGKQKIKAGSKLTILDTPGVLARTDDKGSHKLSITASRTDIKDPDLAAYELMKEYRRQIMEHYNIEDTAQDEEELLEDLARKLNRLKSGGVPDVETAAKMLLQDWQKGKILI